RKAEEHESAINPPRDKDQFLREFSYADSCKHWEGKGRIHLPWWGDRAAVWIEADEAGPSDRQLANLRTVVDYDGDLRGDFGREVYAYHLECCDDIGYHLALTDSSVIWELLGPATLVVLPTEDASHFLLTMECSWDPEHGLRVRFENWSVVEVGHEVDV